MAAASTSSVIDAKLSRGPSRIGTVIFAIVLLAGLIFIGQSIARDLGNVELGSAWPYILLGTALLVALGFEFVNGFHDTANAVATVIYTHSLDPISPWSGPVFGISSASSPRPAPWPSPSSPCLPVELILQVGSGAGFAMVFALLIAAILWNLGTWWLGLPASSSHTMIGSIIGVGIANQLMSAQRLVPAASIGRRPPISPSPSSFLQSLASFSPPCSFFS